jgi:hypothetical protein
VLDMMLDLDTMLKANFMVVDWVVNAMPSDVREYDIRTYATMVVDGILDNPNSFTDTNIINMYGYETVVQYVNDYLLRIVKEDDKFLL